MPVVLQPQDYFTVVRQIANHLDVGTYYVRAVVRNAYTDDIIETLDLEDKGGQRFKRNWRVPADASGRGFYISIVTSVYTDSGYTTKSENYGDEEDTYLVQERVLTKMGGGSSGASGPDAYAIRRIVREEIEKIPKPEPVQIPEPPVMRFDEVLTSLQRLETALQSVPKDKVDTSPIIASIEALRDVIEAKPVTPETDLSPIIEKLDTLAPELSEGVRNLTTLLDNAQSRFSEESVREIARIFEETEFKIAPSTARMAPPQPKEEEEQFDITRLAA